MKMVIQLVHISLSFSNAEGEIQSKGKSKSNKARRGKVTQRNVT